MTTPSTDPRPLPAADPAGQPTLGLTDGGVPATADRPTNGAAGRGGAGGGRVQPTSPGVVPPDAAPPGVVPPDAVPPDVVSPEPVSHRTHGPGHAGRHRPDPETLPRLRARGGGKRRRLLLLIPILLTVAVVGTGLGHRYWYESTYFVSTDNASVTGELVQVGSLNAGRIVATRVDVGRPVREGQEIAVVAMPQELGTNGMGGAPRMGITGTTDTLVPVYSPLNGVVAARMGYVGGTVAAGQPIYALVDPKQVWVRANIEESSAWRIEVGQPVQVHVDALNRDFSGHVDAITPARASTFSLLPASNTSGNFTKVTQYVPIKILVDTGGVILPLGTSVAVRIAVRQPSSGLPLPWQP